MIDPKPKVTTPVSQTGPLSGFRVIDLTVALAGPYCTLLLGGMGAEIIKIEAPGGSDISRNNPPFIGKEGLNYGKPGPDDLSVSTLARQRNKKSVTLDLKTEQGRKIFYDLIKHADVLVENFSEGTTDRLGISYETLRKIHPRLIYASISAFGVNDPNLSIKGMDIIVQALSGVMEINGFADGPPCRVGLPIADLTAPHYALSGILAALLHRSKTGLGQQVKVNMLDSLAALLAVEHVDLSYAPGTPPRSGNHHDRLTPFGVYRSRDGYVAIAASIDIWAHSLFRTMGRPELVTDARSATRSARAVHANEINQWVEEWSGTLNTAEIVQQLTACSVAAVPVKTPHEVLSDPAMHGRGAIVPLLHPIIPSSVTTVAPGLPIHFSACQAGYDRYAEALGQSNNEIYTELLQLTPEAITILKEQSII